MAKIIFVGGPATGKTSTLQKLKGNPPSKDYMTTIGADVNPFGTNSYIWDCPSNPLHKNEKYHYANADYCVLFGKDKDVHMEAVKTVSPNVKFIEYTNFDTLNEFIQTL
jgi:GTPase SAR1 family protein